jgi:hypothetical protein
MNGLERTYFSPKRKAKSVLTKYRKYELWFQERGVNIDVHEHRFAELEELMKRWNESGTLQPVSSEFLLR